MLELMNEKNVYIVKKMYYDLSEIRKWTSINKVRFIDGGNRV